MPRSSKYRTAALRTANLELSHKDLSINGAMGLCGEAGEVCDLLKKWLFHGVSLDKDKLLKELSDVRWYLELLCYTFDTSIEELERINIQKLTARYPNGFNSVDAIQKRDEK